MLQIRQGYLKNIFKEYQNIVLFGAGTLTTAMFEAYKGLAFEKKVNFILDNDSGKDGKTILIHGKEIPMISIERFSQLKLENYALIIMPVFMLDIVKQLDTLPAFDGVPTYIYAFLMNQKEGIPFSFRSTKEPRIPKTIHYLWFGGKELPDKYKKNIESWKKYCPDFEIVRWDESNSDTRKVPFMRQACEAGSWAYVTDYARKDILYHYGGIYFDTDVEVIKPLEDLLYNDFFVGRDDVANISSGAGIGAVKGNPLMKALRDDYANRMFTDMSGKMIAKACGVYETALLIKHGYQPNNTFQQIDKGSVIFPREVLCPISWIGMSDRYTENTLCIHKYDDLLIDEKGPEMAKIQRKEIQAFAYREKSVIKKGNR